MTSTNSSVVKPSVKIIAETVIIDDDLNADIANTNHPCYVESKTDGEELIEFAGRNCYQSFSNPSGRSNKDYIENLKGMRHYSVLEHANVTFNIEGVSRWFTHELVRHRHLSPSQLSLRYVDAADAEYVCPPLILSEPDLVESWMDTINLMQTQMDVFAKEVRERFPDEPKKRVNEAIRYLAPGSIATKIVMTGNFRAWRELVEKRWTSAADYEFKIVAGLIKDALQERYPYTFGDIHYV